MRVVYENGDEESTAPRSFIEAVIPNDGRQIKEIVLGHGKECSPRNIGCENLPPDFAEVYFKCPELQWIARARTHEKREYVHSYKLQCWIEERNP